MTKIKMARHGLVPILLLAGISAGQNVSAQDPGKPVSQQKVERLLGMDSGPKTPAGFDRVRLITGTPKRNGEAAYSMTARWRLDGSMAYESTGLAFIMGPDKKKADTPVSFAKKLSKALPEGMLELVPTWRGVRIEQPKGEDGALPEIIIENLEGYSMSHLTLRDFSNQDPATFAMEPSFDAKGVQVALDLVDASSVDFISGGLAATLAPTIDRPSGGTVTVTLGDKEPVVVQTDGKTPIEVEKELAKLLSAAQIESNASRSPLVEDTRDRDVRNVKPFDGHEVQLTRVNTPTFSISVQDQSLGLITKIRFTDQNEKSGGTTYVLWLALIATIGGIGYIVWKQRKEAGEGADAA